VDPIITKTMKHLNCWLQRDLSLKGRGLLVKLRRRMPLSHCTLISTLVKLSME